MFPNSEQQTGLDQTRLNNQSIDGTRRNSKLKHAILFHPSFPIKLKTKSIATKPSRSDTLTDHEENGTKNK